MNICDKNLKYKRLFRRASEAYHVKRRILRYMASSETLYEDNSGNRVDNPKWFEYLGSSMSYHFKTYYTGEVNPYKLHYRYNKRREYRTNIINVKDANDYLVYEVSHDCKIKIKNGFQIY